MPLRRVLLRLLALAVFFNTVIGMPVHESGHLRQAKAAAMVEALSAQEVGDAYASQEQDGGAHGACAWCLALGHLGTALASHPAGHASALPTELPAPRATREFVPGPGRWPFASRDPPRAAA
ncbi:MAG TPA: hypothetical protein VLJ86_05195 [Ramlibacter sp.]|nr:hypothetical protein [Ramlibacter sp.]